jgi:hypothetical protein
MTDEISGPARIASDVPPAGPSMSTLELTGGPDSDHTDRLLRALGHDPKDAR